MRVLGRGAKVRAPRVGSFGRLALVFAAALGGWAVGAGVVRAASVQEAPFPHETHEGLFPSCAGCHAGAESGDPSALYPPATLCAACHDGVTRSAVSWRGPTRPPSNVRFDHLRHLERVSAAGARAPSCEGCHTDPSGPRMAVDGRETLETCWGCHSSEPGGHLVGTTCTECHVPLAESRFEVGRIAGLPVPEDHARASFLAGGHGRAAIEDGGARCATCHTRERCAACHVDAADRRAIQRIPVAPPRMVLPPAVAAYPAPASHTEERWLVAHGAEASRTGCTTCHTSNDCRACHVGAVPAVVEALPARGSVPAPGVGLEPRAPESHEGLFFLEVHPTLAASDARSCATCHAPVFCVACHDAPPAGGYHPSGFVSRHVADAYGRATECASCHNQTAFCLECHQEVGVAAGLRTGGGGYHDAEPLWLLRHGQAARQSLESCASCHEQPQCMSCHGTLGAFRVSPHTQAFDAEEAWARSPRTCLACHYGNPLAGTP